MKFIVTSSELLSLLQSLGRVISTKNTLPVLDCFLFSLKGNEMTLTASDLESTLVSKMRIENSTEDGCIAIPARILMETLKGLSSQPVTFTINQATFEVIIISEKGQYSIVGQNGADFPSLPVMDGNKMVAFSIGTGVLLAGINKSLFGTDDNELRPTMGGIFIEATQGSTIFTASDGHKLVSYKRTDVSVESDSSFILPKKPASLLKNILLKETGEVTIEADNRNVSFVFGEHRMVCRLIEGSYPNYRSVIPKDNPKKITVDRVEFLNSLKRVAVFSNKQSNLIKLQIEKGKIELSARDIDYSISAYENVGCRYEDEEMFIGFKSTFLMEILSNITSKDVVISLSDPTRAGLFLPVENNDTEDLLMLLMPMMINE